MNYLLLIIFGILASTKAYNEGGEISKEYHFNVQDLTKSLANIFNKVSKIIARKSSSELAKVKSIAINIDARGDGKQKKGKTENTGIVDYLKNVVNSLRKSFDEEDQDGGSRMRSYEARVRSRKPELISFRSEKVDAEKKAVSVKVSSNAVLDKISELLQSRKVMSLTDQFAKHAAHIYRAVEDEILSKYHPKK